MRVEFQRLRFLVIEDNTYMRRILRTLLHGFGVREVYEAADGAAGLEAIVQIRPDIVITDWEMPIVSGLELTQHVRRSETSPNPYLPIIMITGYCEKSRVLTARDAGVSEFLVKPISAKQLYERVLSVVAHPGGYIRTKTYFGPDRRRPLDENLSGPERRKDVHASHMLGQEPLVGPVRSIG